MARVTSALGPLLTGKQAAAFLGTTDHYVRGLVRAGELPALCRDNGRLIGIYESHLTAWQRAHLTTTRAHAHARPVDARMAAILPAERRYGS